MKPTRKITAVGLGGALATLLVGIATWLGAPDPPAGLEAAFATVFAFGAGYLTDEADDGDGGAVTLTEACLVLVTLIFVLWALGEVPR